MFIESKKTNYVNILTRKYEKVKDLINKKGYKKWKIKNSIKTK